MSTSVLDAYSARNRYQGFRAQGLNAMLERPKSSESYLAAVSAYCSSSSLGDINSPDSSDSGIQLDRGKLGRVTSGEEFPRVFTPNETLNKSCDEKRFDKDEDEKDAIDAEVDDEGTLKRNASRRRSGGKAKPITKRESLDSLFEEMGQPPHRYEDTFVLQKLPSLSRSMTDQDDGDECSRGGHFDDIKFADDDDDEIDEDPDVENGNSIARKPIHSSIINTSRRLPVGWEAHEDEDGAYYWHIKSGTIQRDFPPSLAPPRVSMRRIHSGVSFQSLTDASGQDTDGGDEMSQVPLSPLTSPSNLPNSISDYVAVNAFRQDSIHSLSTVASTDSCDQPPVRELRTVPVRPSSHCTMRSYNGPGIPGSKTMPSVYPNSHCDKIMEESPVTSEEKDHLAEFERDTFEFMPDPVRKPKKNHKLAMRRPSYSSSEDASEDEEENDNDDDDQCTPVKSSEVESGGVGDMTETNAVNLAKCLPDDAVRFAVRSLGWVRIDEEDLTPQRSSKAVNKCIVELAHGRNHLLDVVGRWGDGKDLWMVLDQTMLQLIDPQDGSLLHQLPIHSIRVWGVGRDNDKERDFAYVARDRITRKYLCHVFRCERPARTIANTLRDICRRIMLERSLGTEAISGDGPVSALRPTHLLTGESRLLKGHCFKYNQSNNFPTPMEEPRKVLRAHYLGAVQVPQPTGMDVLHPAIDKLSSRVAPERWQLVDVAVAPSTIKITEASAKGRLVEECRVRYLSFMGIGHNVKLCAFIVHTPEDTFLCHVFHCDPSACVLCKTVEAACKLRYQKCLDAHRQSLEMAASGKRGYRMWGGPVACQTRNPGKGFGSSLKAGFQNIFSSLKIRKGSFP